MSTFGNEAVVKSRKNGRTFTGLQAHSLLTKLRDVLGNMCIEVDFDTTSTEADQLPSDFYEIRQSGQTEILIPNCGGQMDIRSQSHKVRVVTQVKCII